MKDRTFDGITRWIWHNIKPSEYTKCHKCKKELLGYDVWGYPHDGGYTTKRGKQWLYIKCKCGYENSLGHMRIPHRDFSKEE